MCYAARYVSRMRQQWRTAGGCGSADKGNGLNRLLGKIVIVTGGARGMGAATARLFAHEGATVIVADLAESGGTALAAELGGAASFHPLNVTIEAQWEQLVREVSARHGRIDGLVNNAGILHFCGLEELAEADFDRVLSVNLKGTFFGLKHVGRLMKRARAGAIVNISSIDGLVGVAGMSTYAATKFAVTGYTRSLALEVGQLGIRVNAVHPGIIATPLVASVSEKVHARLQRALDRQAIPRMGRPQEIANAALFLASDEASYVTGASLVVDGGHIAGPFREPAE